jgi:hypothetical protein
MASEWKKPAAVICGALLIGCVGSAVGSRIGEDVVRIAIKGDTCEAVEICAGNRLCSACRNNVERKKNGVNTGTYVGLAGGVGIFFLLRLLFTKKN